MRGPLPGPEDWDAVRLPEAAWPELCGAARELGCLRRLQVGVAHACRPFPMAVPAEVLRGLACDPVAPGCARYLCRTAGGNLESAEGQVVRRSRITAGQRRVFKALELPEPPLFSDFEVATRFD